jgi:hypothetical protein
MLIPWQVEVAAIERLCSPEAVREEWAWLFTRLSDVPRESVPFFAGVLQEQAAIERPEIREELARRIDEIYLERMNGGE